MKIDRRMLERITQLSDEQLTELLFKVAEQSGIPREALGFGTSNVGNIRTLLQNATDEDLSKWNRAINDSKLKKKE